MQPPVIERVLFVANDVHVYGIPPLASNKGFNASGWTSPTQPTAQQIFTARLRIIETSVESKLAINVLLEDGNTGELFAGAPYTSPAVVQQALDSSRFFAVRVQADNGMKATLGIGFEDRAPAFDFSVALGDARKVLAMVSQSTTPGGKSAKVSPLDDAVQQDYSLKAGEKIHIQLGSRSKRQPTAQTSANADLSSFSIALPPPPTSSSSVNQPLPPPPSQTNELNAADYGFDDGEFGEFQ